MKVERWENGLHLQMDLAVDMLKQFRIQNEEILHEMDVDMSLYGKMDMTGVHEDDPEPCPNVWDEERGFWTHDWKNRLIPEEVEGFKMKYEK
jgi:small subunit ribosomal protein S29